MMKTTHIETGVQHLLDVLDDDIRQLEVHLSKLDELRRLVVKQDHAALNRMLNTLGSEAGVLRNHDQRRLALCRQLADIVNCVPGQFNLSRLQNSVSREMRSGIQVRKEKLQLLSARLQKELAATQGLLADCARFNRMLLKAIFKNRGTETLTYNPSGVTTRQTETILMNVQL